MKIAPPIHPFLLAMFPVLFLYSHNVNLYSLDVVFTPLLIILSPTLIVWFFLGLLFKNWKKSALITSLFLLLFFLHGHMVRLLGGLKDLIGSLDWVVLSLFIVIFATGVFFSVRARGELKQITKLLNFTAAVLIAIPLISIIAFKLSSTPPANDAENAKELKSITESAQPPASFPNIYYIVVDGYARADVLSEIYRYDNSEFLNYLREKGFYVAERSRSNYVKTTLSLGSSLNLKYLDDVAVRLGIKSRNYGPLLRMIKHSVVSKFLKSRGYKFVAFSSGYYATEIKNADRYIRIKGFTAEFENELLNMTPISSLLEIPEIYIQFDFHRERVLRQLERLPDVGREEAPCFVFAHIISPHPPFVFGKNGGDANPEKKFAFCDGDDLIHKGRYTKTRYIEGYRSQLIYLNKKLKEMINGILSNSEIPPIIILQADHGPGAMTYWKKPHETNFKERHSILNAYYLPGGGSERLYSEVTPVNTFRIVFNYYFGARYKLLKDSSYFSTGYEPYKFIDVTAKAR
jgi:hypothetical protein